MKHLLSIVGVVALLLLFQFCGDKKEQVSSLAYINHHDTVSYVGMNKCIECHQDVHAHFSKTGMGQSFDEASKLKSSAKFNHAPVYDSNLNYYYQPLWKNDSLNIEEYRLMGSDTVYKRTETIDYIIGSGQHTNSHLTEKNGYLSQAPITFYTQRGVWDLAPGFENGMNSRFTRTIKDECISCHNAYPTMKDGSNNVFEKIELGIDCERCHGPGEIHVQLKTGKIELPEGEQGIIHPKRLTIEEQNNLCQRCHLQGVNVFKEGKGVFDFKPGMLLKDVMDVYMPQFEGADGPFIMASHVERLSKSECFIAGEMSCITCHHPHYSVTETAEGFFDKKCQSCHKDEKEQCKDGHQTNCTSCHMPKSGSVDIPHVAITDHYIRVVKEETKEESTINGLSCINNDNPSKRSKVQAYLNFYEKYSPKPFLLDSANLLLKTMKQSEVVDLNVHLSYLQEDYTAILALNSLFGEDKNYDAWTHYRIGEANLKVQQYTMAEAQFEKAIKLDQYNIDFRNKLGVVYLSLGLYQDAIKVYEEIFAMNDQHVVSLSNYGYVNQLLGRNQIAFIFYEKALALNPDYKNAFLNKISLMMRKGKSPKLKKALDNWLEVHPNDAQVKTIKKKTFG